MTDLELTCDRCRHLRGGECRLNPPTVQRLDASFRHYDGYPIRKPGDPACSQYDRKRADSAEFKGLEIKGLSGPWTGDEPTEAAQAEWAKQANEAGIGPVVVLPTKIELRGEPESPGELVVAGPGIVQEEWTKVALSVDTLELQPQAEPARTGKTPRGRRN